MSGSLVLCPCPVTGLLPILITGNCHSIERKGNTNCLLRVVIVYLTRQIKHQGCFNSSLVNSSIIQGYKAVIWMSSQLCIRHNTLILSRKYFKRGNLSVCLIQVAYSKSSLLSIAGIQSHKCVLCNIITQSKDFKPCISQSGLHTPVKILRGHSSGLFKGYW